MQSLMEREAPSTLQEKPGGARRGILTAHEVFLSFVTYIDDGTPDASGIFSPECFQTWLRSRQGLIQHPEQTFHRTLVAHVRGSDTRKPFPIAVEEALLRLLRDRGNNPWDRCFGANSLNVGKFGFKHKGYHEIQSSAQDSDGDGVRAVKLRLHASGSSFNGSEIDRPDEAATFYAESDRKVTVAGSRHKVRGTSNNSDVTIAGAHDGDEEASAGKKRKRETSHKAKSAVDPGSVLQLNDGRIESKEVGISSALRHIQAANTLSSLSDSSLSLNSEHLHAGLSGLFKEQKSHNRLDNNFSSLMFDPEFVFPAANECYFDRNKPVASIIISFDTFTILASSTVAQKMLNFSGEQLNGMFFFNLIGNVFELMHGVNLFYRNQQEGFPAWKRTIFRTADNKNIVCLTRNLLSYSLPGQPRTSRVEFQDVSPNFCSTADFNATNV